MTRLRAGLELARSPREAYVRLMPKLAYRLAPRIASRMRQRWAILKNPHAEVSFGPGCSLGPGFSLHMPGGGSFIVGAGVEFRRGFRAELSGADVTIGHFCVFSYYSLIQCTSSMRIGNRAKFGQSAILIDGNHRLKDASRPLWASGFDLRPLHIADDVTTLTKVTIINDIGRKSVVAANSVVNKPVPPYSVVGGVPAKLIDYFGPPELTPEEWRTRKGAEPPAPRPNRLEVTGHSIAHGGGVSSFDRRFTSQLAEAIDAEEVNSSVAGAIASWHQTGADPGDGGYAHVLRALTRPEDAGLPERRGVLGLTYFGLNDLAALGPAKLETFGHALRVIVSRHRATGVFEEDHPSFKLYGDWALVSRDDDCSGGGVAIARGPDKRFEIAVPASFAGGTIAVGCVIGESSASALTIELDGKQVASIDLGPGDPYGNRTGAVARVRNLAPGKKILRGEFHGTTSAVALDYWQVEPEQAPPVLVPLAYLPQSVDTYRNWSYQPEASGIEALNRVIRKVAGEFDGGALVVDVEACMDADDKFGWDSLYPSDEGHAAIARACAAVLGKL